MGWRKHVHITYLTAAVLTAAAALSMLSACRQKEDPEPRISEVTLWARVGHSRDYEINRIQEWNLNSGERSGIRIVPRFFGGDYDEELLAAAEAGNLPDLFNPRNKLSQWVKNGDILAIEDIDGGDVLIQKYRNYLVDGIHVIDGKTYTVPAVANTFRLAVNRDLLRQSGIDHLPASWDEVSSMALKVTEDSGGKAYGIVFPMRWGNSGEYFWRIGMIYGFANTLGVDSWYNPEKEEADFGTLEPILKFVRNIKQDKSYLPGTETLDNDEARKAFAAGNAAFISAASWDYGVYVNQFPIAGRFEWSVIEFPGTGEFKTPLSSGVRLAGAVSAGSRDNLDKVFTVVTEFLYNDEILRDSYAMGLYLPVLPELSRGVEGDFEAQWREFAPTVNDGPELPNPDGFISIGGPLWYEVFMEIWKNESLDITEALQDLDRRYNAALSSEN